MLIIARDTIADTSSCVIRYSCMGTIASYQNTGSRYVLEEYSPPIVAHEVFRDLKSAAERGDSVYRLPDPNDVNYTWEPIEEQGAAADGEKPEG